MMQRNDLPKHVEDRTAGAAGIGRRAIVHETLIVVDVQKHTVVQGNLQPTPPWMADDVGLGLGVDLALRPIFGSLGLARCGLGLDLGLETKSLGLETKSLGLGFWRWPCSRPSFKINHF